MGEVPVTEEIELIGFEEDEMWLSKHTENENSANDTRVFCLVIFAYLAVAFSVMMLFVIPACGYYIYAFNDTPYEAVSQAASRSNKYVYIVMRQFKPIFLTIAAVVFSVPFLGCIWYCCRSRNVVPEY